MKKYIFGYGSLINLQSASRTLKRPLLRADVHTALLKGYGRYWNLFDEVHSSSLDKEVKAVFLNVSASSGKAINGIIIQVNDLELENFKVREKNYDCVDVTNDIEVTDSKFNLKKCQIFTFVGKLECLTNSIESDLFFVFNKYINIVTDGISSFGEDFHKQFDKSTEGIEVPIMDGDYTFIDYGQQNAR